MEIITNLTITINEAQFKDRGELLQILQGSSHEKKGSSYIVTGTYEELLKLFNRLSAVVESHRSIPGMHGGNYPQNKHVSTHVKSMKVSGIVMSYIMQKRSEELNKILGNSFTIETQPDMGAVHINPTSTVQVQVRECPVPVIHTPAEFVRQRFTSFYQRTASDLQVITVSVGADDRKDLQADFPDILFIPSHNKHDMTVTGPFVHIAEFKELMKRSSSRRQVPQGPAVTPKKRTPCSSPTGNEDSEGESCLICMEPIVTTEKETLRCKHSFCKNCLKKAFEYKPVCPTCGEIYGVLRGTQPDGGEMDVTESSSSLPGYEKYGTIIVKYYIPSGIQTEEHPHPGQRYEGASREAYLPNSQGGKRILKLLRRAFDQRLIFTVGQSTTSGRRNTVTWNDIHHKTSMYGGPTQYGYPDPGYLNRVQDELKAKGIE